MPNSSDQPDSTARWFLLDCHTYPAICTNGSPVAPELTRLGLVGQTTLFVHKEIMHAHSHKQRRQFLNGRIRLFRLEETQPIAEFVKNGRSWQFQALA